MKVLITGFFLMKPKHMVHYTQLWKYLGATEVDCYQYPVIDAVSYTRWKHIRETRQEMQKYDVVFCMSGGSLYLHNLRHNAYNPIEYDKIVYDSGPFFPNAKQGEHYVNNTLNCTLPLQSVINFVWRLEGCTDSILKQENTSYLDNTHHQDIPKLILTSDEDKVIIQSDIEDFVSKQTDCLHHRFKTGGHVQLYRKHPEEYQEMLHTFIN